MIAAAFVAAGLALASVALPWPGASGASPAQARPALSAPRPAVSAEDHTAMPQPGTGPARGPAQGPDSLSDQAPAPAHGHKAQLLPDQASAFSPPQSQASTVALIALAALLLGFAAAFLVSGLQDRRRRRWDPYRRLTR